MTAESTDGPRVKPGIAPNQMLDLGKDQALGTEPAEHLIKRPNAEPVKLL
jgi:hypothetical protein